LRFLRWKKRRRRGKPQSRRRRRRAIKGLLPLTYDWREALYCSAGRTGSGREEARKGESVYFLPFSRVSCWNQIECLRRHACEERREERPIPLEIEMRLSSVGD